jgi:hypothetical protein
MRRFLAGLFIALSGASAAQAAEVGSIHGFVMRGHATPSVSGITIEVREGGYRQSVETDALGRFTLLGLPPGPATIRVSGDGWMSEIFNWCVRPNESDAIPIWIVDSITAIPYFQGYYDSVQRHDALRITTDQYTVGGC